MRGILANAILVAGLLIPLYSFAQSRGGPRFGFSLPRQSFRSFPMVARTRVPAPRPRQAPGRVASGNIVFPPVTGTSLINPGEASCLLNPSYGDSYYCRQYYPHGPSLGFEPVFPVWFPTGETPSEESVTPSSAPQQDLELAEQVGSLTAQVEMLRENQAMKALRTGAPPAAPAVPEEKPPSTVFVFRDGRQLVVQDYALMGGTLWVFNGQQTRRVLVSGLDLDATRRINSERGVDFVPPDLP